MARGIELPGFAHANPIPAAAQIGPYGAQPGAEREAELDAIEAELAKLAPDEQAAELRRLGLTR